MTDTNAAIAAFLAKGGSVRKVEAGARTTTEHEMKYLVRGETPPSQRPVVMDDEYAYEREAEVFASARMGGASQDQAMQELNDFRVARHRGLAR